MNIGILGGGISGLSIAQLLRNYFNVEVLEKQRLPGGIARTKQVQGMTYHLVGGHCFNSKFPEVLDFVFGKILPLTEWRKIQRKSKIQFHSKEISYPIEFAVKEIYQFDKDLALKIMADFLNAQNNQPSDNLQDWFINKFGETLAQEYFIPYNSKIWNKDPAMMSSLWVEDKLPIPNKYDFLENIFEQKQDKMPHSEFYYPKSNDQNTFIDKLAQGTKIVYDYQVHSISQNKAKNKWIINHEKEYDLIISTLPLKEIPLLLTDAPVVIKSAGEKLKYNKISNVFWKTQPTDKTWTYLPEKKSFFHRYIHIGSYFNPIGNCSISEAVGDYSFEEMKKSGELDPFLIDALDYHVSDYAYVVFDENYQESTTLIKDYIRERGLYTLGRFGEWQYYNMDVCIKKAIELSQNLLMDLQNS